jgi:putative sigma-54 modulation protein
MAVEVEIYGKNMDISDRLRKYVDKKISKLDRFLVDIEDARVDVSYEKSARSAADRQVAQITLRGKGFILRTEERADDIFVALDQSLDKMQRQIERYKGKRSRGRGDGKTAAEVVHEVFEAKERESSEVEPLIAHRKRFTIVPMDEAEAVEQMTMLGHENFFVFYNVNSHSINVLYKRWDGSIGILEPVVG